MIWDILMWTGIGVAGLVIAFCIVALCATSDFNGRQGESRPGDE